MNKKMLSGAEYILKNLRALGIKNIFGVPGLHIDPLYAALVNEDIEPIVNCHELSAAYMADGYSRAGNNLGVVIGIGGPGSNNMITAVNTAKIEKVPLLIITGDIPINISGAPGFQCGNKYGSNDDDIFKIITKYSKRIKNIQDLEKSLKEAIEIALSPPYGPTHLIVPHNVFNELTPNLPKPIDINILKFWKSDNSDKNVSQIKDLIMGNKKIIFWIGDSLNKKEQAKQIIDLAERFHIPIATSYSGKGVVPETHKLALGNFGFAGSHLSKEIFISEEPDVIIGFDIEQNERNSLNWNKGLYQGKELILVNFPGTYSNKKYGETIEDNPFYVLKSLHSSLIKKTYDTRHREIWFEKLTQKFKQKTINIPNSKHGIIEPSRLVQIINNEISNNSILFVDSGNHRIFPGLHMKVKSTESFYSASAVAPLGWAIAASIGSKFIRTEPVILITGDGCMQMHGIELKTAIKYNRPILVIIVNNNALGSIHMRFSKISKKASKMADITEIDWNIFSKSFGADVFDITSEKDFIKHLHLFNIEQKLTILNVFTPVAPYIYDKSLVKSAYN